MDEQPDNRDLVAGLAGIAFWMLMGVLFPAPKPTLLVGEEVCP